MKLKEIFQNKKSEEIAKFIIEFIKEKNISIYDETVFVNTKFKFFLFF